MSGIDDPGFLDLASARRAAALMKQAREQLTHADEVAEAAWRTSIVRRQAEALIQLIDQRIERQFLIREARGLGRIAHNIRNLFHFVHHTRPAAMQKPHHGDLELLCDESFDLNLAAAIFELAQAPFEHVIHSETSGVSDGQS